MPAHACRFCTPNPEDFLPSYASALVFPGATGLADAIFDAEKVGGYPMDQPVTNMSVVTRRARQPFGSDGLSGVAGPRPVPDRLLRPV